MDSSYSAPPRTDRCRLADAKRAGTTPRRKRLDTIVPCMIRGRPLRGYRWRVIDWRIVSKHRHGLLNTTRRRSKQIMRISVGYDKPLPRGPKPRKPTPVARMVVRARRCAEVIEQSVRQRHRHCLPTERSAISERPVRVSRRPGCRWHQPRPRFQAVHLVASPPPGPCAVREWPAP